MRRGEGHKQFSVRVGSGTFADLERRAHERGEPRNALTERYIAEGARMDEHPEVVFRDGALGRRAMLAGTRLDVWQVVETVRNSGNSIADAAEYLALPPQRVEAAVNYYAMYREEVDALAERERALAERAEAVARAAQELLA